MFSAKKLDPLSPSSSAFKATKIMERLGLPKVDKVLASSNKNEVPEALSKAP